MRRRSWRVRLLKAVGVVSILVLFIVSWSHAETGVTKDLVKIGTSQDLSGTAVFFGKGYLQGMNTYFKAVNEQGGIHGRKIELVAYDDKYEASRTVSNFKRLVYEDKVFCMLQIFGTPNTLALLPLVESEKIPLLAPSTSAVQVAIPPKRYVFPVWPLLPYYGRLMVDYAVSDSKSKSPRVAFIYVDNDLGKQQIEGAQVQAKEYGFDILDLVPFKPGTIDFTSLLLRIKSLNPDYVMLNSVIKETAAILKKGKEMGWSPQFLGMTAAVDQSMLNLAGDAAEFGKGFKAYYACYLSHEDLPGPKEYRDVMQKYAPGAKADEVTFHGFGAAKMMVEGLKRAGKDLTREGLVSALETLKEFSDGVHPPCTFGPNYRVGSTAARLLKVSGGRFVAVSDWQYPKFVERK